MFRSHDDAYVVRQRRRGVSLAVAVGLAAGLLAVDTRIAHGQIRDDTRVAGVVTDLQGEPIANARVTIRAANDYSRFRAETVTGEDGRFELDGEPGECRLFVTSDGYAGMSRTHEVFQGLNPSWDFRLPRSVNVFGRILDTSGRPQPGRAIELWPTHQEPPPAPGTAFISASGVDGGETGADGSFAIRDAAPGRYRVIVYRPSPIGGDRNLQQVPVSGGLLELRSGQALDDVEICVNPPEDFAVSGHVTDSRGDSVPGITVDAFIPHGRHWWTKTLEDGSFRVDGLDGIGQSSVRLNFNGVPGAESYKLALRDVPVNAAGLTLKVPSNGSVAGQVRDAKTGAGVTDFDVTVPFVTLLDSGAVWEDPSIRIERRADARFGLTNVPAGLATVEIRAGNLGAQRFTVEVEADATVSLDCEMRGPAVVAGTTALEGAPRKTTIVVNGEWLSSDDAGNYRFDSYPNGPLTLWFFMGDGWHRTAVIELVSGETVGLDMEMGGSAEIHGSIRFEDTGVFHTVRLAANPSPDGWLEVGRPTPEEHVLAYAHVHPPAGDYLLRSIPPGRWHLMVGRYEPAMHRSVLVDARIVDVGPNSTTVVDYDFSDSAGAWLGKSAD